MADDENEDGNVSWPSHFLTAIDEGNLVAAAFLLRERTYLTADEIRELADLLDPLKEPTPFSPFKLIATRKRGKPALHPLIQRGAILKRILTVEHFIRSGHKVEFAIEAAADELQLGRSTVAEAWAMRHRIRRLHSPTG